MKLKYLPIIMFSLLMQMGFLSAQALALCVSTPDTNLYAGPGYDHSITARNLPVNTPLRKLDVWNDWIQVVDLDQDSHWVHTGDVVDHYYCLIIKTQTSATLREGPGNYYSIIGEAYKYEVFRFIQRQGEWLQIANDDDEGFWLLRKNVWVQ